MNDRDARLLHDAAYGLKMARITVERMSPAGREELDRRIGGKTWTILNQIMRCEDRLGDAYTDRSREHKIKSK